MSILILETNFETEIQTLPMGKHSNSKMNKASEVVCTPVTVTTSVSVVINNFFFYNFYYKQYVIYY